MRSRRKEDYGRLFTLSVGLLIGSSCQDFIHLACCYCYCDCYCYCCYGATLMIITLSVSVSVSVCVLLITLQRSES